MDPRLPWPLLWGALCALPTAALAPLCLPAAALLAALGILGALCTRHPHRRAGLCALPALLAGLRTPEREFVWPTPGPMHVVGTVDAVLRAPLAGMTFVQLRGLPAGCRLHCAGDLEVLPGDRLTVLARLSPAIAPGLPPTLQTIAANVRAEPGAFSLPRLAATARRHLERELLRLVPGENGTMLATLVLGRGTATSPELLGAHQATGLSHLLAVSGAHAAMLAFMLGLSGFGRGRRLGVGRTRTALVLAVLAAYAAITGNEPPVLRAVVTFGLAALATQLGRPFGVVVGLVAPAMVTCVVQPDALLGPSFLLSYAAVIGLAMAGGSHRTGPRERWLLGPLRASLWATLLTAPLTLHWFGQIAPWTVLLTPMLAPVVAALLLGGLVSAILACLAPALADPPGAVLAWLADVYANAVRTADLLPGTPVHAVVVPPVWLLGVAGLAAVVWIAFAPRPRSLAGAAVLLALPHFLAPAPAPTERLSLLAVGHGQACVFTTASGYQAAIDCGSLQHPGLAARRLAQALARRHLDLLVVTHADQDHHNGVAGLLRRLPVTVALLPAGMRGSALANLLADHGTAVGFLAAGQVAVPLPGLRVAAPVLPPDAGDNDRSLWVRLAVGTTRVLLTGDAEVPGVAAALAQGLATPCEVLVLPHHGRPNALAPTLLRTVRPRTCLASAAAADGQTALGSIARGFGCDLWVTGQHGDLELLGGRAGAVQATVAGRRLPPLD